MLCAGVHWHWLSWPSCIIGRSKASTQAGLCPVMTACLGVNNLHTDLMSHVCCAGAAQADMQGAGIMSNGHSASPASQPSGAHSNVQYDQSTGMYYMPDMGCYWDGGHLYGDASSGQWYSFKDGQYQLVS